MSQRHVFVPVAKYQISDMPGNVKEDREKGIVTRRKPVRCEEKSSRGHNNGYAKLNK